MKRNLIYIFFLILIFVTFIFGAYQSKELEDLKIKFKFPEGWYNDYTDGIFVAFPNDHKVSLYIAESLNDSYIL